MSTEPSCVLRVGRPLERILFAMAGTVALVSAPLVALVIGRLFGLRSPLYGDDSIAP
jgi:hypothetical protein